MAEAAYENPLIPNPRLRQIYLAMARARMLARELPAGRRDGLGLEAGLVSTSIDLGPADLVSDALSGGVVEFLRGQPFAAVTKPVPGDPRNSPRRKARARIEANCGTAARMPATPGIAERIWAALGAAAVLKTEAARAKAEAAAATPPSVVVAYARPGEVAAALWRKALTFAAGQELPMVFVVLPSVRVARSGKGSAAKVGGVSALALRCGVPGIAVDADDAVAIYRVAQESIGRARIGGGTALIECVPFVIEGAAVATSKPANDAIAGLKRYMLERKVCTKAWLDREARTFAKRMAATEAAS